jgi:hypothetical protein
MSFSTIKYYSFLKKITSTIEVVFLTVLLSVCVSFIGPHINVYAATINAPTDYLTLNADLIGWWTFDGDALTSATATDMSGNGNNGTLVGSPTPVIGKVGQALKFNNQGINLTDTGLIATSSFTVTAWIKASTDVSDYRTIIDKTISVNNRNYWLELDVTTGNLSLRTSFNGTASAFTTSSALNDNRWHHVTASYDGSHIYMYVDGTLVLNTATTGSIDSASGMVASIGYEKFNNSRWFSGSLDDVRIYNRALSATEVQQLYNATAGTHTNVSSAGSNDLSNGLVGWWTMDGKNISSTTVSDTSGNGNDGTLTSSQTTTIGKVGQALVFDGTGGMSIGGSTVYANTGAPFTLSTWYYLDSSSLSNYPCIIALRTNTTGSFDILFSSNPSYQGLSMGTGDGSWTTVKTDDDPLTLADKWHHMTIEYNGQGASTISNYTVYVDGVLHPVTAASGYGDNSQGTTLGWAPSGNNRFKGKIDDVRIYNRALSATEVQQLYNATAGTHTNVSSAGSNDLSNGLVGWWTMDGKNISSTTVSDTSGNGNNGTMVGSPTPTIGKVGQALNFNGTNQYIQLNNSTVFENDSSGHSVSFWIYLNSFSKDKYPTIFNIKNNSGGYNAYYISNQGSYEGVSIYNGSASLRAAGISSAFPGKWNHVAIVFDGVSHTSTSSWTVYLNGVPKSITTGGAWASHTLNVIGDDSGSGDYVDGKLDDVRIYNRALSATEVQQLYNMGR